MAKSSSEDSSFFQLRDVRKSFDSEVVLQGVEFSVSRGETFGIIGPSGGGKSVLLKCMVALLPIDSGELYFDRQSVPEMSTDDQMRLRQRVGFLFQQGGLFDSISVGENLEYALHEHFFRTMKQKEIEERVGWALDAVGIARSEVTTMPHDLSGGMQKRVGIARTIVTRPEAVMYDSPTDGLDPQNAHRISDLIAQLGDELKMTSVIASHDLRTVFTICDRVGFLDGGRMQEIAPPASLAESANPNVRDFVIGHPPEEPLDPLESQPPEPWKPD